MIQHEKAIVIKDLNKKYYKKKQSSSNLFNNIKSNNNAESFFALKNINLEINKGEIIGIIGPNGAGKSTLLKILAEVTPPTSGKIEINGKIASILEIGIGFQPDLSGYENIFLSGRLYGLSKKQIKSKLEQIIEMFGFPDFINTPVKYYSSGMYMRLAFAIITNIEADIYLLDEVTSVGDSKFRTSVLKTLEKLKNNSKTIIVVTHNPQELVNICDKFVVLMNKSILAIGEIEAVLVEQLKVENSTNTPNVNLHNELINPKVQYLQKRFSKTVLPQTVELRFKEDLVQFIYRFKASDFKIIEDLKYYLVVRNIETIPIIQVMFKEICCEPDNTYSVTLLLPMSFFGLSFFYFDIASVLSNKVIYYLPYVLKHKFNDNRFSGALIHIDNI